MHSQTRAFRSRAILLMTLLVLLGAWAYAAQGQSSGNSTSAAKPVLPANPTESSKEPEMSRIVPVRPDGMISLPLLGEIKAAGLTPVQLRDEITAPLKKLMADPEVTVIVTEVHSLAFNMVGQVLKPGYYPLTRRMTVLDAIALAGGFRDFAKQKKIYVLRTKADGSQVRLPFNYKQVIKGKNAAQNIELQPRDTVVVP